MEEAKLQEHAWENMLKFKGTGEQPHESVIGEHDQDEEWDTRGIMGERVDDGEFLYLIIWGDIFFEGARYGPFPTWETKNVLRQETIDDWIELEKQYVGMKKRVRKTVRRLGAGRQPTRALQKAQSASGTKGGMVIDDLGTEDDSDVSMSDEDEDYIP